MFAIKTDLLRQLLSDDECSKELDKAKTHFEVKRILVKYARKHGLKVGVVNVG